MKYISDSYGERCRFDAFCKTVLRNEAKTYLRDLCRQRKRETQFSALSQHEIAELCTVDEYFRDKFVFSAFGYVLYIQSELVANSFASLPECEQQILILHYALELPDREVGDFVGMSRSAVQRHRTKTLNELQKALEQILRYYDRYVNKICTRTLYDKNGLPYIGVDEYMKHRLQAKLTEAIVNKK